MRWLLIAVAMVGLIAAGYFLGRPLKPPSLTPATVVERLRAVSRLGVLDVSVTRKVTLLPDPVETATLTQAMFQWARYAVAPPSGTALVSAEAHFAIDLSRIEAGAVRVSGNQVEISLPEPEVSIELTPAQTEVLVSNLDSQQTTALLAKAQAEFAASLANDPQLLKKARLAAERSLSSLMLAAGFKEVRFDQASVPATWAPATR